MNSNFILWTLGGLSVIAFVVVLIIQNFKQKIIQTVSKLQDDAPLFSDSEVGRNLHSLVTALSNGSENSSVILEKLKNSPQECAKELTIVFTKLHESAYNAKWLLVYCTSQFELPEFIDLLKEIAQSEIPPEKSKNLHLFSTIAEETTIRLRAVEGLKSIARTDNKEAESVLFELLKSNYITLSIASCQGLLEINEDNKTKILTMLPKERQFIIDIKRKDIKEIPFIKNTEQKRTMGKTPTPKPRIGENNIQERSHSVSSSKPPKTNHY
ncbi:MAG TPA: hypothetical protein VF350_06940 [Candidatus Bathyarchaeia archaeon]